MTGQPRTTTVAVDARVGQTDDWVGRLQLYVPAGFTFNAPAAGAQIGTGQLTAIGTLVGPDQIFTMGAKISAISATDPALSWQTTNCDNSAHVAAFVVNAQAGDDAWSFPIFVDQTTGSETQFGQYKLVACFGPRNPGAANSQANKFMGMSLTLNGFGIPTKAGDYKWRALWTPFAGDQSNQSGYQSLSSLNQAASVESQSTTRLGSGTLTLGAKKSGTGIVLSGKLVVNGEAMNGITIAISRSSQKTGLVRVARVTTNAAGTFSKAFALKRPAYFQAGATVAKSELGASGCTASFGVPCVDATVGGTAFVSKLLHVKP